MANKFPVWELIFSLRTLGNLEVPDNKRAAYLIIIALPLKKRHRLLLPTGEVEN